MEAKLTVENTERILNELRRLAIEDHHRHHGTNPFVGCRSYECERLFRVIYDTEIELGHWKASVK
ncbi:MAG: hypothetical protein Q8R28_06585 [Dehalococcoidia bacterium]|nr:hypothetical protein [Dehalococcoidia bacterium]